MPEESTNIVTLKVPLKHGSEEITSLDFKTDVKLKHLKGYSVPADGSMSFDLLTKIVSVSANIPLSVASELSLQDMEEVGEAVGGFLERSPPD